MSENLFLSDNNPNDGVGGGGCVCSPTKVEDCKGPYAIFPASETDSNLSPHVVISLHCAKSVWSKCRTARKTGDLPSAGEKDTRPVEEDAL